MFVIPLLDRTITNAGGASVIKVCGDAGVRLFHTVSKARQIETFMFTCVNTIKHMSELAIDTIPELAEICKFLGNVQRLYILKSIAEQEKYAREISEEVLISRPLVNIYLKQFEKRGLVSSRGEESEEAPYFKKYYRAVPFELVVSLDVIRNAKEE
jgi:ArsR family transcriptional regulator